MKKEEVGLDKSVITITKWCNYRTATLSMDCGGLPLKRTVLILASVRRRRPSVLTAGPPPAPPLRPPRRARRSPPSPPPPSLAAPVPRAALQVACLGLQDLLTGWDIPPPACPAMATPRLSHSGLMTPSELQPLGFHLEENRKLFSSLSI